MTQTLETQTLKTMARRVGSTLLLLSLPIAVLAFGCGLTGLADGTAVATVHVVGGVILLVLAVTCFALGMAVASTVPPARVRQEQA